MNLAKYQWNVAADPADVDEQVKQLQAAGLDYSPAFLRLCIRRGYTTPDAIREATNQEPQLYHDPFSMYQMDIAVERLQTAVENQSAILIYGDYDADGITSTLILYEALESLGANIQYYLPNRLTDGYGPNLERYQAFIEQGIELILTCDNGVAGHEAIAYAQAQGVDVIVSDHHEMQDTLPNAFAIIHPRHPQGEYPFGDLSGAGVALKIASALLDEIPTEAVELAAIGTLCDLVSLTDENRTIVIGGLNLIGHTQRIGLQLLFKELKINTEEITADTIGFMVGPRLNAMGRLGDATPGLELLKTLDEAEAVELVQLLNETNQKRQSLVKNISAEVEARIETQGTVPFALLEADQAWPAGVLGIVASRLVDKYQRPAILFQFDPEKGQYKGSGRSIQQVNLFEWLNEVSDYILYYGGHSQAAGLTVEASQWEAFKTAFLAQAEAHKELLGQSPTIEVDGSYQTDELTEKFIREIQLLGPFGMDNPQPKVMLEACTIKEKRVIGSDKQHVKLLVTTGDKATPLNTIGFSMAEQFAGVEQGASLYLVGALDLNEWRQVITPQMKIDDMGMQGVHWVDYRSSKVAPNLLQYEDCLYVFRHKGLAQHYKSLLRPSSRGVLYQELFDEHGQLKEPLKQWQYLAIMEPPKYIEELKQIVQEDNWRSIYLGAFIQESKYTVGEPTREEFGHLYRWIQNQGNFNVRQSLAKMSQQLKISETKLKHMIVVFFEAEFVTIKDGFVSYEPTAVKKKVDLLSLPAMQQYRQEMQSESLLNYQTLNDVKRYFEEIEEKE